MKKIVYIFFNFLILFNFSSFLTIKNVNDFKKINNINIINMKKANDQDYADAVIKSLGYISIVCDNNNLLGLTKNDLKDAFLTKISTTIDIPYKNTLNFDKNKITFFFDSPKKGDTYIYNETLKYRVIYNETCSQKYNNFLVIFISGSNNGYKTSSNITLILIIFLIIFLVLVSLFLYFFFKRKKKKLKKIKMENNEIDIVLQENKVN